jgi:putative membrane-bound dehydrogenase-like protein
MFDRNPPRAGLTAWAALAVFGLALAAPARTSGQVGPEDSARNLRPADGLEATLWAAEPMVLNPTNIDIDSRGRVWVTEGLNYRLTRNPSQHRVGDADKIKILEDTDGDGKADKVTVFADRIFPVPMGIAVEERYGTDGRYRGCRVFVGNSPDLLVLEDTDGDDKADKRYPLLTGFGGIDSDHGVHGMVLGLDGELYFTHGDGCCSVQQNHSERTQNFDVTDKGGRHVSSDQLANTLRCDRDGTHFEILCDRQRNNYETCLNAFGNIFTSDNDDDGNRGCRVIQVFDGGHYGYRTPGSPRHWGEDVPGNIPKLVGTGNGSPCGIMVYEGDQLPDEYRGGILEADAGTRQINFFPLTRRGASFRTSYQVFLASDDPWFRPVDMTAAPDGSVFVADWYDSGVGGHAFRDQTTGRIYRVGLKGSKSKSVEHDFGSIKGLIAALKSPVVAAQDAARRLLVERSRGERGRVEVEAVRLFTEGRPVERARALWVLWAIAGDRAARDALRDDDPRIREQAVRMLGRDDRLNGNVELTADSKRGGARIPPAPAVAHLDVLLPLAADPDAGVRRELILALRNVPTDKVGAALRTLARTWDGQDRWYLEALGLALDKREKAFLSEVFDGTLYGALDLDIDGRATRVALPPYFPVDRNEAFIEAGAKELPVSALSKTLGLAWRVHSPEVLPFLARIGSKLKTSELQQAVDDVVTQVADPSGAVALAEQSVQAGDRLRQREVLALLARKLDGAWRAARGEPKVVEAIMDALDDAEVRLSGIQAAAATGDARYGDRVLALSRDAKAPDEVRVAAVEALGRLKPAGVRDYLGGLVASTKGQGSSSLLAEAAVRTWPLVEDPGRRLADLISSRDHPLGLRREALRTYARLRDGGQRILAMAKDGKLPGDLKTEATTIVNTYPDRDVREQAARVLPLPKTASGRPLPSFFELLRREGKADQGRDVFFREPRRGNDAASLNTCSACHRVQGRGQWVGPDLSTIGTKYGKDELLRSILNPSAAIGYNFRTLNVALKSGQTWSGLPVEDTPERLVLKTSDGKRVAISPGDVEERRFSDVSLMPEGLAESMSVDDLVDLLAFLSGLRQPVSIVGQYQAAGPFAEENGTRAFDPTKKVNLAADLRGPAGQRVSWRRLDANAEGLADLAALTGGDPKRIAYAYAPVVSPVDQEAQLVIDTKADVKVWLNGQPVGLPGGSGGQPRAVVVNLPKGRSDLLIRVAGGPNAGLVTTLVSDQPLAFRLGEVNVPTR